jgi:hypothetical protein
MAESVQITHQPEALRFEAIVDGLRCEADYQLRDGVMWMTHTGVPSALEGRGIAAQLVSTALAWARSQGLKVQPSCSYVAAYMRRHPETQDLLAR